MTSADSEKILVRTSGEAGGTRGGPGLKALGVDELSAQVKHFLGQLDTVLKEVPDQIGVFQFAEFEVAAEVTATGSIAIVGIGGEAGATGGLRFVFRRNAPAGGTT